MSIDTARPPEPPEPRAALLEIIAALPDEAVERLWRFGWLWVQGPEEPPRA